MSIRITLLILLVIGFSIYAWRNWFVSLCASVVLMAVMQHPDMPTNIGGIQGLNPWNFLILNVALAWGANRGREGLVWDMPPKTMVLFGLYVAMVVFSALRLLLVGDGKSLGFTTSYVLSEQIFNCLKWVVLGLLLFDACRTARRIRIALAVILLLYFLLAVQVIRWVPLSAAIAGSDINRLAAKMVQNEIGYNRVTLSMMLGGASWAALCCLVLAKNRRQRLVLLATAATMFLGQSLTGGRIGYVSWLAVGLALSLLRWRKLLLLIPVMIVVVFTFLPGVRDRLLQGFASGSGGNVIVRNDEYEITSGRNLAWPLVIDKIQENPIFGYGRQAMSTTGISGRLMAELDESFPHPHNAYLEVLLDNGLIGFCCIIPFYLVILWHAIRLLLDRENLLCTAVGGVACALVTALLVGAMGGQTFYPREGAVGMWAAMFVMLRVSVERQRSVETGLPLFAESEEVEEAVVDSDPESTLESA